MQRREVRKHAFAARGERDADEPMVRPVRPRAHEARLFRAMNQLAGAVVPEQQLLGDLPDRRRAVVAQTLHHDKELVLGRRDAFGLGRIVAPSEEPAKRGPERQELWIVHIHGAGVHVNVSYHDIS